MKLKLFLTLMLLFSSSFLKAQSVESFYASVKSWEVKAETDNGQFLGCFADKTNPNAQVGYSSILRLGWNGHEWLIGTDFPNHGRRSATILIDNYGYETNLLDFEDWTIARVFPQLLHAIKNGGSLNYNLEPDGTLFSLSGSAAALLKIEECVSQAGQPPQEVTYNQQTLSQNHQGNVTDEYIETGITVGIEQEIGIDGQGESYYGNAAGWVVVLNTIFSNKAPPYGGYCLGSKFVNGIQILIGSDGGQWQMALPVINNKDWYGRFEVDGKISGMAGTATKKWTIAWLGRGEIEAIRDGNEMVIDFGGASYKIPLAGSHAMYNMVRECVKSNKYNSHVPNWEFADN